MEWCPDGEKLLTATTAPRLRMGNGFKVWHYSGALLHETAWPVGQELLQVIWQKYDENAFKEKAISNVKVQGIEPSQPQSSSTKYVPPNIRSGASSILGSSPRSANYQPERGPIPGLPVGYKVSQGQRKKERNTKRKDGENATKPGANTNTNSSANEESGGKSARAPQNASSSTQSNNKQRNNQRTPRQSNNQNQNHSIGNGANANNQNQNNGNDSNAKAIPNTDPNVSGNEHSNADSDEARKAKRDGRQRNRQRKSESGPGTSGDPEKDKRVRTVQQKLKDIAKLKVRRENGENLEANQLSKIKMEAELVKELSALKVES